MDKKTHNMIMSGAVGAAVYALLMLAQMFLSKLPSFVGPVSVVMFVLAVNGVRKALPAVGYTRARWLPLALIVWLLVIIVLFIVAVSLAAKAPSQAFRANPLFALAGTPVWLTAVMVALAIFLFMLAWLGRHMLRHGMAASALPWTLAGVGMLVWGVSGGVGIVLLLVGILAEAFSVAEIGGTVLTVALYVQVVAWGWTAWAMFSVPKPAPDVA